MKNEYPVCEFKGIIMRKLKQQASTLYKYFPQDFYLVAGATKHFLIQKAEWSSWGKTK